MKPSCPKRTKHYQPVGSKQSSYSSQHRSKKPSYDDSTCHMTTFDPFPNTLLTKASSTKSNAPPFHPTPQNNYHYQNPKAFQQGVSYIKVSSSSTAHL